jgi:hypothetical protein
MSSQRVQSEQALPGIKCQNTMRVIYRNRLPDLDDKFRCTTALPRGTSLFWLPKPKPTAHVSPEQKFFLTY